jgi:error-prone DNA polymerase
VGDLSPDEADQYQKAITHARSPEEMARLGIELYERARHKGITKKAFSRLWKQIQGFSKYGFAHGHAVAFGDHAQGTAWLLRHYPADFLAGVLSVEPCGFWPVSVVVAEAQRRGVEVRSPDINRSSAQKWMLEEGVPQPSIRSSLAYVRTVAKSAQAITFERKARGPFTTLEEFCCRCHFLSREQLEWLALAGALDSLAPNRRQTLWSLPVLHQDRTGQRRRMREVPIPIGLPSGMPEFSFEERYWKQWSALGFSSEGHPMMFLRDALSVQEIIACAELQRAKGGQKVRVAGLVVRPHRPPTAGGVLFFTLEDETGLAHVAVMPDVYQHMGAAVYLHGTVVVTGRAERRGEGVSLLAESVAPLLPC